MTSANEGKMRHLWAAAGGVTGKAGLRYAMRAVALLTPLLLALPAAAQDDRTLSLGKRVFQERGKCSYCHGWAGDGEGDPFAPRGANIRDIALTREQLVEVVQCGRPDTEMPHFDRRAYVDDRCFGMTAADLGDAKPPLATDTLRKAEMEAVADYVIAKVLGRGDPTLAECEEFFSPGSRSCAPYR